MDNQLQFIQTFFIALQIYNTWMNRRAHRRKKFQAERLMLLKRKQKCQALITLLLHRRRRRSVIKSCWIQRELLTVDHGRFWESCVPNYTDQRFQKKFRLSRTSFEYLCHELSPYLMRKDTIMRKAIPLSKRIAVALTVLKGNIDYWSVADLFGIGKSTVGHLVHQFCEAAVDRFYEEFVMFPSTEDERIAVSEGFMKKCQFPDCFGAMDGTHIPILAPPESTEDYYNYKSFYSIVVLAVVDSNYRFMYANVGAPGRCNDASIFRRSKLFTKLSGVQNGPPQMKTNLHIISDAAFPLLPWVMKPYPITIDMTLAQKNYNYRLSSARMTVENSFGRLKGRWRILLKRADLTLDNMKRVIKTCLVLHNLCEKTGDTFYPQWATKVKNLEEYYGTMPNVPIPDKRATIIAKVKRDMLAERLMYDGVSIDNDG